MEGEWRSVNKVATKITEDLISHWASVWSSPDLPFTRKFLSIFTKIKRVLERAKILTQNIRGSESKILNLLEESSEFFDLLSCR